MFMIYINKIDLDFTPRKKVLEMSEGNPLCR